MSTYRHLFSPLNARKDSTERRLSMSACAFCEVSGVEPSRVSCACPAWRVFHWFWPGSSRPGLSAPRMIPTRGTSLGVKSSPALSVGKTRAVCATRLVPWRGKSSKGHIYHARITELIMACGDHDGRENSGAVGVPCRRISRRLAGGHRLGYSPPFRR